MYLEVQQEVRKKFVQVVQESFGLTVPEPVLGYPPDLKMGELSVAACFELAKPLRRPPRKIAEELAQRLLPIEGIERVEVAGGGYLNFYLHRAEIALSLFRLRSAPQVPRLTKPGKILVEHTSINPNKAAHIGHLRNAVLGDTFARLLRFQGNSVEVQNYIDNTGVQVADVVVGFLYLEKKSLSEIKELIRNTALPFDYYCWDLYARVFQHYEDNPEALALRGEVLQAVEEGEGATAQIAETISTAVVRAHLETMRRINVEYDLLVQESEILRLQFWKKAFELMKEKGAIRFEPEGKNRGCWVMRLAEEGKDGTGAEPDTGEDVKIIVRSNGTVTYVGKDIAYHLWKFGLLGKDFGYRPFHQYPDGRTLWITSFDGSAAAPSFGQASRVYCVIDTRQSYLQNIVAAALRALDFTAPAENLHHFSYDVVGLTPACAEELGYALSAEDRGRSYVEVSGRKGLGVKADDLINRLMEKALTEVQVRQMTQDPGEQAAIAQTIAVSALRYFLLKFSRRVIIAFDFGEALAFEGETGPYLQYSVVRARNIFRKYGETRSGFEVRKLADELALADLSEFLTGPDGDVFWELALLTAQLELIAEQAVSSMEPAVLAKYAFRLAQAFNNFYHRYHILNEPNPRRQQALLFLLFLVSETLSRALDLLGIEVPTHM